MNKEAAGITDFFKNLGVIKPDGTNYSWASDAAKLGLGGAGLGAGAAGLGTYLFGDEEDPERRNANLQNNILMGAALGGMGGLGASSLRNFTKEIPEGMDPNGNPVKGLYGMARAAGSFSDTGNAAAISAGRGVHRNRGINKLKDLVNDLRKNKDLDPLAAPDKYNGKPLDPGEAIPNSKAINEGRNAVSRINDLVGADSPHGQKAIADLLRISEKDKNTLNFKVPSNIAPGQAQAYQNPLREQFIQHGRAQMLGKNDSIVQRQGNIGARILEAITGKQHATHLPMNQKPTPAANAGIMDKLKNFYRENLDSKSPIYESKLSDAMKTMNPDKMIDPGSQPGLINKAKKLIPFSRAGKASGGGATAARTFVPAYLASKLVNNMAPYTTDPLFGGAQLKNNLDQRGLAELQAEIEAQVAAQQGR